MAVIEIVGGVILLVVSVVIFALTLMQHTHGQGLAGAINGSAYGANNARLTPADQMLSKLICATSLIYPFIDFSAHRRYHLLCGGHPGLRVRKPSGLSMRPQPRDESGAVFVSICCYKRDKREEAAPRWRAGYGS